MKFSEVKIKSPVELREELLRNKKELLNLRFKKAAGELKSMGRFKLIKKTIARIKTVLNQKG